MAAFFRDSFDYYDSPNLKWTAGNGAGIDLSGTQSRTGIGALIIGGITAPALALPPQTGYTVGLAYSPGGLNNLGRPIQINSSGGLVLLFINPNGSITLADGNGDLATSAGAVMVAGAYTYLEMQLVGGGPATVVTVRANGVNIPGMIGITANIGGVINEFTMSGPSFGVSAAVDDVYVNDDTGTRNNGFLGPVRIYAVMPSGDSSPLDWTPSVAGPHFSLINQIPENGGTSYVQAQTVNDIDQYVFQPSGIPTPAAVQDVQVSLLSALSEAGARSVAVQIGGSTSTSEALSTSYHYVLANYDVNPDTGVPWLLTDFPATVIGPIVTA